jgi:16S rRNA (guanine966-N2)-methyltransferase
MIKIVGGLYRSRILTDPPLNKVRPTQDILRKAVFSALGEHLQPSCQVLDLFAGSGAYGFEALSRGAGKVTFNDLDRGCLAAIKDSGSKLKCLEQMTLINLDCHKAIMRLAEQKAVFDLVFLDPPYVLDVNQSLIMEMEEKGLLSPRAVIIAEQEKELTPLSGFNLKTYKYSYKRVGIYRKEPKI